VGFTSGVGREAPLFALEAANGDRVELAQFQGDWFPVIVFVPREADETVKALAQLDGAGDTFWGLRGQVLAVTVGDRAAAEAIDEAAGKLRFPLLADDGSVAAKYGALADDGTVRPMAFIVDRAGKIVWMGEGWAALRPQKLVAALRDVAR